ncbi:DUF6221 family protein [Streptomyces sp900105755]|uniref:DUF6221 family protein n=1 Tax=Streptomyces sp. 900105755 TaxID=3154389 RepID=UPI0033289F3B
MSDIADFLRARYAERRSLAEAASPGPWHANAEGDEVLAVDGITVADGFALSGRQLRATVEHIAAHDPVEAIADLDAKLALLEEFEPPPDGTEPDSEEPQAGWCCDGHAAACPLCPQYGTGLDDPCPGHPGSGPNKTRIVEAQLHASFAHPGYEYRTTDGPRKQWDDIDRPPCDWDGEPEPGWERNIDAGRAGMGWDRFDYTEESYWRRLRPGGPRKPHIPRGLRIMAKPFAGHPDHKGEEWAP